MIRSMTGYGTAEGVVGRQRVSLELRSVNHRFFTPTVKLPASLARWEHEVREQLRRGIARGHVTVIARAERDATNDLELSDERFGRFVARLRELQARHELAGPLDIATVLGMPQLFGSAPPDEPSDAADDGRELLALVERAVAALTRMREEEGGRLESFLDERLRSIEAALERITGRAPARLVEQRDRLRSAVKELTEGIALDEARIAQEIAVLADRLDVTEELERFRTHLDAFRQTLAADASEPVGKRLGFLLQELVREANTMGSKANDSAMLASVVLIKEELERLREQVENLE